MSFEAKYPGRCGSCDNKIHPGDDVHYEDDELVHDDCPGEVGGPIEVCPDCWCIHRGECA
ncbi:hypothetical protein [Mycobacterium sp. NPDC050853]|uniref:hypothetical protein n=1 Tax=Mycobacterium sp. NPDC050853 TaxID=3155160 RepID=UPI0033EB4BB6